MRSSKRLVAFLSALALMGALSSTRAQAVQTNFVAVEAIWKYRDDGSNQGTAWTAVSFNDNAWIPGAAELGYGDADESTEVSFGPDALNKHITTYFRHEFEVTGAASYTNLLLRLKRDDGAVAYLNGTEIARSNMPAGTITSTTLASSAIGGPAEESFADFVVGAGLLLEGDNVLAVEIHQDAVNSSDISFAAELIGADAAAMVVRGPYLQSATPNRVTVRWRTSSASDSRVWYGLTPATLTAMTDDASVTTEHEVELTGLVADTRYYYAVGDTAPHVLSGGDADHFFVTSPATTARKDLHLWALGDAGTATSKQRSVRDAYDALSFNQMPHLWLMLGDNAYFDGTDIEFENGVFDMYPRQLQASVMWPTLGNHDGSAADSATQTGPYYDIFTLPTAAEAGGEPSFTEAYYAFDVGHVHVVCLESHETDRSATGAMMTWLEADLQAVSLRPTPPEWIIAFWHHPPYSKGSHDSDTEIELMEMRANALPILEDYGVDLVMTGHSHSYERSFLLDGHYGLSGTLTGAMILDGGSGSAGGGGYQKATLGVGPHEGAVYVVAGSSGQTSGGPLNHPAQHASLNTLGSLVVDIDRNVLDARFLSASGSFPDAFRLVKGGPSQDALDLCPALPRTACRTAEKTNLLLKQGPTDDKDLALFKWVKGETFTSELGDPRTRTDYALCVYDAGGTLIDMDIPSSGLLWQPISNKGFKYKDLALASEGAFKLILKGSTNGKSRAIVKGKGVPLPDPGLPATLPVTAQLINSETGVCWSATYATALRNDGTVLKAKTP